MNSVDDYTSSQESSDGEPDFDFEGGPLFSKGDWVAYPEKDKNGNWFLRVRNQNVPGLRFQLFPNSGAHDGVVSDFNRLVNAYNEKS